MPLITFEGIDGAGKTSVIETIAKQLHAQGVDVLVHSDFAAANNVARLLKVPMVDETNVHAQYHLIMAARILNARWLQFEAMGRGTVVLFDRYLDSTLAYQGTRGVDAQRIEQDHVDCALPSPVLTIILDLPPAAARARRGPARDRMEHFTDSFFHVARNKFLEAPASGSARHAVVDADRPMVDVVADCVELIQTRVLQVMNALLGQGADVVEDPVIHNHNTTEV